MYLLDLALLSHHASDSSPADSVTLLRDLVASLLKHHSSLYSTCAAPIFSHTGPDTMASTSGATPAEPSTAAEAPAKHSTVAFLRATTVDLSMYGPPPPAPASVIADSSLLEEILSLHTTANAKGLELDFHLANLSAYISDLYARISEFPCCDQDFTDHRATLMDG